MSFLELINNNIEYIIIGLVSFLILLLILVIIQFSMLKKLNKKYRNFMSGSSAANLEGQILARFTDIDGIKAETKRINVEIAKIKENLLSTYQKIGIVKYDAFKEMGGKLSFVLVLLDKNNNGIIFNSVHSSREGCYTYLKEIIKGESFLELSEDEKAALKQAINSSNFME